MTKLEILLLTLDEKIKNLKIVFDEYQKITISISQANLIEDFEYLKEDIKVISNENIDILEALNAYIQKRVDVVTTMSVIVKYCLSHENFLGKSKEIIDYLEKTYDDKSDYQLMYLDCYLNSSLAALNIANKYNFIMLLKNIKDVTYAELATPGMSIANLQMAHALTFMVLANLPIDIDKMVKLLEKNEFDNTTIFLKAIEDAHKINPVATDNFIDHNKEWLKVDLKSNLATFEAKDWVIIDHVASPTKKKIEDKQDLFHENLIREYSDILKIFKDVQNSKAMFDLSYITDEFKSLLDSAANPSIDFGMKESLNISNIPLIVDIEDILANTEQNDILKLMGNSNGNEE